jgi:hypothetical protein
MRTISRTDILFAAVILAATAVSLFIPVFTRVDTVPPSISHPALYPFYYQTNKDSPIELDYSLQFPEIFRTRKYRINRPVIIGTIALLRNFIVGPVVRWILPESVTQIEWGPHRAVDILITYLLWIVLNIVFTFCAVRIFYSLCWRYLSSQVALSAALIFCTAPIVVYGLREIHQIAFEMCIISASLWFWQVIIRETPRKRAVFGYAVLMGVLFLGKMAVSTFATGALLCLLSDRRKKLLLIVPGICIPSLVWMIVIRLMGMSYVIHELGFGSGIWIFRLESFTELFVRFVSFSGKWILVLWESTHWIAFPFFIAGIVSLRRRSAIPWGRMLLLFALVDLVFYFLVRFARGSYGIHTMVFYFAVLAEGIWASVEWVHKKYFPRWTPKQVRYAGFGIVVIIQLALNLIRLPSYPG